MSSQSALPQRLTEPASKAETVGNVWHLFRRGSKITVVTQALRALISVATQIVMARMLSPEDFGLVAMAAVVVNFLNILKDAGLSISTIQCDTITQDQVSSLFWLNACLSLGLALATAAAGRLVAGFYSRPELECLTVALALPLLLTGMSGQHRALLQRDLQFGKLARIDIFSQLFGLASSALFASLGFRYWALAAGQVGASAVGLLLAVKLSQWRPTRFRFGSGIGAMLRFGLNHTGFNCANFICRNLDSVLIGRVLGAELLGVYSRAYSLMLLPLAQVNAPLNAVLLPLLSRLQNYPDQFAETYLRVVNRVAWLTVPAMAVAAALGENLVVLVLGESWRASGEVFQVLALAGVFQPLANISGCVFMALGRTDRMFRWGVFSSLVLSAAFAVSIPSKSVVTVAWAYVAATMFLHPVLYVYAHRRTDVSVAAYWRAVRGPIVIAIVAYAGVRAAFAAFC